MESPIKVRSGWSGMGMEPPKTIERRRRGRGVDVIGGILPTPPRSHTHQNHLPTPESAVSQRKLPGAAKTSQSSSYAHAQQQQPTSQSGLPTPQTLPRNHPRKSNISRPSHISNEASTLSPPSPSGVTTEYFLASGEPIQRERGEFQPRRRPGLTFAQQMGLVEHHGSSGSGTKVQGVGVGIGGIIRSGHLGRDRVEGIYGWGKLQAPALVDNMEVVVDEENPFLVSTVPKDSKKSLASPGELIIKRTPRDNHDDFSGDLSMDIELARKNDTTSSSSSRSPSPLSSPLNRQNLSDSPFLEMPPSLSATFSSGLQPTLLPMEGSPIPTISEINRALNTSASTLRTTNQAEEHKRKQKKTMKIMMIDEDSNPFYVKPGQSSTSESRSSTVTARQNGIESDLEERPFVTYVFRGTKKVFANPWMKPSQKDLEKSELSPKEWEFEPIQNPKPKLLWPEVSAPNLSSPVEFPVEGISMVTATPKKRRRLDGSVNGSRGRERDANGHEGREEESGEETERENEDEDEDEQLSTPPLSHLKTPGTKRRFQDLSGAGTAEQEVQDDDEFGIRGTSRAYSSSGGLESLMGDEDGDVDVDMDEEEEEEMPVRRGLLFGGPTQGGSMNGSSALGKRALDAGSPDGDDNTLLKKSRKSSSKGRY